MAKGRNIDVVVALLLLGVTLQGCGGSGGDGKHYMFITSLSYNGNLKATGGGSTGLEGGDKICANHAAAGGLSGTWKAWLSDSSTNAIDRINDVGPWYAVGTDKVLFNNKANLTTIPSTGVTLSELGNSVVLVASVWTGTLTGGAKSASTCADWSVGDGTSTGAQGEAGSNDAYWTFIGAWGCGGVNHLYCIQQ